MLVGGHPPLLLNFQRTNKDNGPGPKQKDPHLSIILSRCPADRAKNHWRPLTLFLRVAGAPLDNNICERALKKAILHRKGSLFYKTQNGAHVGDLFMSLIHSCQLSGTDPFDDLTELQRHAKELAHNPQDWMPWNYEETLGRTSQARAAPS